MVAELGPAKVKVTLDVADARRQIEALKGQVSREKQVQERVIRKVEREGRDVSGGKAEERPVTQQLLDAASRRAQRFAARGAAGIAPVTGLAARAGAFGPVGAAVAGAAVAGAAAYGAARYGAELALLVQGILKEIFPAALTESPLFAGLRDATFDLARRFDALEANIGAALAATSTTKDYVSAVSRITGTMPSAAEIASIYAGDQAIEARKSEFDKQFKRFKRLEVFEALGRSIGDSVKQSMTK